LGGRTDVDVSYQYLSYFLEDDDELKKIHDAYESGEMLTGELKKIVIKELWTYVEGFQKRRAQVNDEVLKDFMDGSRKLCLGERYKWHV
jgi:tryptophanyl-tRNA synthetase